MNSSIWKRLNIQGILRQFSYFTGAPLLLYCCLNWSCQCFSPSSSGKYRENYCQTDHLRPTQINMFIIVYAGVTSCWWEKVVTAAICHIDQVMFCVLSVTLLPDIKQFPSLTHTKKKISSMVSCDYNAAGTFLSCYDVTWCDYVMQIEEFAVNLT